MTPFVFAAPTPYHGSFLQGGDKNRRGFNKGGRLMRGGMGWGGGADVERKGT